MSTCFWDQDLLAQPKLSRNSTLRNLPQRSRTCSQPSQTFRLANRKREVVPEKKREEASSVKLQFYSPLVRQLANTEDISLRRWLSQHILIRCSL